MVCRGRGQGFVTTNHRGPFYLDRGSCIAPGQQPMHRSVQESECRLYGVVVVRGPLSHSRRLGLPGVFGSLHEHIAGQLN